MKLLLLDDWFYNGKGYNDYLKFRGSDTMYGSLHTALKGEKIEEYDVVIAQIKPDEIRELIEISKSVRTQIYITTLHQVTYENNNITVIQSKDIDSQQITERKILKLDIGENLHIREILSDGDLEKILSTKYK